MLLIVVMLRASPEHRFADANFTTHSGMDVRFEAISEVVTSLSLSCDVETYDLVHFINSRAIY